MSNKRLNSIGAAAALVLLTACAGSSASPSSAAPPSAAASSPTASVSPALSVVLQDFKVLPSVTSVVGPNVTVAVMSNGPTPHNFTIRDASDQRIDGTQDLRSGETTSLTVDLAPGDYTIFCALAGHESLGMHSTLTVTAP